jgi:hypothetical protein
MLTWPLADALPVFLALVALAALADGPALAAQFGTRQLHVPPSLYGQVFTTAVGIKVARSRWGPRWRAPWPPGSARRRRS